jgi:hypothetical protein
LNPHVPQRTQETEGCDVAVISSRIRPQPATSRCDAQQSAPPLAVAGRTRPQFRHHDVTLRRPTPPFLSGSRVPPGTWVEAREVKITADLLRALAPGEIEEGVRSSTRRRFLDRPARSRRPDRVSIARSRCPPAVVEASRRSLSLGRAHRAPRLVSEPCHAHRVEPIDRLLEQFFVTARPAERPHRERLEV